MATTAETIYHHTCDLCGHERDEDEFAHRWGTNPRAGQRPQIDICPECQRKPVSEVLAWFAQQLESGGSRATLKAPRPAKGTH